ncbi:MAG: VOC family protein [Acetobacteraceae bacterium]|nr:VOC family protein [Acetobacteraceae bacterium]
MNPSRGIHHITALADDAAENVAFYTGVLGLRLVKRTVNFDDPGTWHLYYGDEAGRPGTILTFFPFPGIRAGRHGTGQAVEIGFAIPRAALGYWLGRLTERHIEFEGPFDRFGERVVRFKDPEGLQLELITDERAVRREGWKGAGIDAEYALRGFHSVTLWEQGYERTAKLLTEHLGFVPVGQEESRFRFAVPGGDGPGGVVDIRCIPGFWSGAMGGGTIHHVAFRAADDGDQAETRERLIAEGLDVTPVLDRNYFHSIYFREPGGVLFEIATDPPGFTVDEPLASLGTVLKLPSWLERRRETIERVLPSLGQAQEDAFAYRFVPASVGGLPFGLVLLHGTGGDENDLVPLGEAVAPGAALLSPRGRVLEGGSPRFFRRLAEGVFDVEDLRWRAHELADFVLRAAARHKMDRSRLFALGYSNGANIASATMLLRSEVFAGAVLLRPMMVPIGNSGAGGLVGRAVLILSGRSDPIVPQEQPAELATLLGGAGAVVDLEWVKAGHQVSKGEVTRIASWLQEHAVLQPAAEAAVRNVRGAEEAG